jgi:hypothetical protein
MAWISQPKMRALRAVEALSNSKGLLILGIPAVDNREWSEVFNLRR